ncbi:hypothetical protein INT47_007995 [Mucor saturninus]|uniref:Uncharacterized protein n=1 Tax=Mucor saturninus TaxID=64648 RepID=A0A8H7R754_9FUNG|nr:hypothetical protein INT47_007995 [Mucor saturninus]
MKFSALKQFLVSGLITVVAAGPTNHITFNVISRVSNNETIGVIIDEKVYPLTKVNEASTLFHYGDAPSTSSGYKYAILQKDTNQVIESENFTPSLNFLIYFYHQPRIRYQFNTFLFNPDDVKLYENVTVSIAGMSTRHMNKLSYKFKLPKKEDLFGYRKIKLRAMSIDMSYMRDSLGYAIADSVGLPTTKHSYARVYINDKAAGLYGLVEHVRDEWVQNEFGNGSKNFKHGALYVADINADLANTSTTTNITKRDGVMDRSIAGENEISNPAVSCSLLYLGNNITAYNSGPYSVKSDPSVGTANYTRIMDLTKFISERPIVSVTDSSATIWEEKMDVDSFLRGLAFEIVISNMDGYFGTSNNYMLYDDIKNERLVLSEQNLDLTMDISKYNATIMYGGNYTLFPGFTARPLMPHDQRARKSCYLGPRIDQLFGMLSEEVAWDLTLPRLGTRMMPNFMGELLSSNSTESLFHLRVYGPALFNIPVALTDWLSL